VSAWGKQLVKMSFTPCNKSLLGVRIDATALYTRVFDVYEEGKSCLEYCTDVVMSTEVFEELDNLENACAEFSKLLTAVFSNTDFNALTDPKLSFDSIGEFFLYCSNSDAAISADSCKLALDFLTAYESLQKVTAQLAKTLNLT
jgi:hypothetical protein